MTITSYCLAHGLPDHDCTTDPTTPTTAAGRRISRPNGLLAYDATVQDILAVEAQARASVTPPPLDPERLAMAMYEHWVKAHICNRDCFPEVMRRYTRLSEAHDD